MTIFDVPEIFSTNNHQVLALLPRLLVMCFVFPALGPGVLGCVAVLVRLIFQSERF